MQMPSRCYSENSKTHTDAPCVLNREFDEAQAALFKDPVRTAL